MLYSFFVFFVSQTRCINPQQVCKPTGPHGTRTCWYWQVWVWATQILPMGDPCSSLSDTRVYCAWRPPCSSVIRALWTTILGYKTSCSWLPSKLGSCGLQRSYHHQVGMGTWALWCGSLERCTGGRGWIFWLRADAGWRWWAWGVGSSFASTWFGLGLKLAIYPVK